MIAHVTSVADTGIGAHKRIDGVGGQTCQSVLVNPQGHVGVDFGALREIVVDHRILVPPMGTARCIVALLEHASYRAVERHHGVVAALQHLGDTVSVAAQIEPPGGRGVDIGVKALLELGVEVFASIRLTVLGKLEIGPIGINTRGNVTGGVGHRHGNRLDVGRI